MTKKAEAVHSTSAGAAFLALTALLVLSQDAHAIHRGADDLPYAQPLSYPLDKPVNDACKGKAFFMNLGPTGIRARIDPDQPFGCQRNATCSLQGLDRTAYTHVAILLLSLPKQNLLITGAELRDPGTRLKEPGQ